MSFLLVPPPTVDFECVVPEGQQTLRDKNWGIGSNRGEGSMVQEGEKEKSCPTKAADGWLLASILEYLLQLAYLSPYLPPVYIFRPSGNTSIKVSGFEELK